MAKQVVVLGTAHNHVLSMAKSVADAQGCELVGVWDEDPARVAAAKERLNVPALESLEAAWKLKPALVLIGAVPTNRARLARQAIENGAAVLVDKPLALNHVELDKTIEAQGRFRKPIITYYPYRGHPDVLAAKALLASGAIGKLVRLLSTGPHKLTPRKRPDWHWTRAGNGGCIVDIGSHGTDLCCWLADASPDYISGVHSNMYQPDHPEFQDYAQASLRFPGGAIAHVEADWFTNEALKSFGDGHLWIQGTTGKIEIYHGEETTALVWTAEKNAQPLDYSGYPDVKKWTATLIGDLANGRDCGIRQDEIWRASRVTLYALDSALAGGKAFTSPRY